MASRLFRASAHAPAQADLDGFRRAQRLSYECATTMKARLAPGMTEHEVARRMDAWLEERGVRSYFHTSLAWFGDATRFGSGERWQALPSKTRRLLEDDVVILDTAPIVDGYVGDVGYTTSLKPNRELDLARARLLELRAELPALFARGLASDAIWRAVDGKLRAWGYDNVHAAYPFSVLGHRVYRVPFPRLRLQKLPGGGWPFTLHTYFSFASRGLVGELLGPKPAIATEGLWAIEPHLGAKGFGAKFEEILVVESTGPGGRAYWLDDEVPHVTEKHEKHEVTS
ncbi:MAG: aminopeptidase P family protein [Deltaproteobacteria bacterium]|nr:aminopeptidase P family protein [Deltaproteobacteria bacterium]